MKYIIVIVVFGLVVLNIASGFIDDAKQSINKHHEQLHKL